MKYIINFTIVFNPNTRVLALKNNALMSIELSKPANRLLCELIENVRNTLAREVIIQNVWVDYGFTPSNANLSNHISELRKAFENLGLDNDVIITLPKVGFRLEAEIHPIAESDEVIKEVTTLEEKGEVILPPPSSHINERILSKSEKLAADKGKKTKIKIIIIVAALLLVSITAIIIFYLSPQRDTVPLVTTIGKCNIYRLNSTPPPADFIETVSNRMERERIDCTQEIIDIYYADTRKSNALMKISFMSVCKHRDSAHYQNCTNYKYVK